MGESIDKRIMEGVFEGLTYKEIQAKVGNVSKSFIKKVIKKENPELYDVIRDVKKLKAYRDGKNNNL